MGRGRFPVILIWLGEPAKSHIWSEIRPRRPCQFFRRTDLQPANPRQAVYLRDGNQICLARSAVTQGLWPRLHKCANHKGVFRTTCYTFAPFCILFNMLVNQGIFLTRWAEANLVPVFKKSSRNSPSNYRAVCIWPILDKIFERRRVYDTLFQHVKPTLTDKQHGFVPHLSYVVNLATLLNTTWEVITEDDQTDAISTLFILTPHPTCGYCPALILAIYLGRN